jgi:hypothetical protein
MNFYRQNLLCFGRDGFLDWRWPRPLFSNWTGHRSLNVYALCLPDGFYEVVFKGPAWPETKFSLG